MKSYFLALTSLCLVAGACDRTKSNETITDSGGGSGLSLQMESNSVQEPSAVLESKTKFEAPAPSSQKPQNNPIIKQKLIKDGTLSVKSDQINDSKAFFDLLVKTNNAYYESERFENNDQNASFNLKIRIPSASFEAFISGIDHGKDEITQKQINTRDITEEFIDLETRLENKQLYLKRYREILSKASAVKDIMTIEENIRSLQEELESTEGRLKYLADQVNFSTIDVYLFSPKPYIHKPNEEIRFSEKLKTALSNGWSMMVGILLGLVNLWPWLIILVVITIIIRSRKNRGKKKPTS